MGRSRPCRGRPCPAHNLTTELGVQTYIPQAHLHGLLAHYAIACDLTPGLIEARHRPIGEDHDRAWRDHMASRYGYDRSA